MVPTAPRALSAAGLSVAAVMALPVVHLVARAAEAADPVAIVLSGTAGSAVAATLRLGVAVTLVASVIGIGLAWVLERTDVPFRRGLGVVAAVPLVVPTYVAAVTLRDAFGPRALLVELPGLTGFGGAVAVLALSTYPYVLLLTRAALAAADPMFEEAARSLGDRPGAVFRRVVLPMLRPAAAAGGLLVFLYVLSDFGAVSVLRFRTVTVAIFTEYRSSFDRARPAVLGVLLVVLTLAAVAAERKVRGRAGAARVSAGARPPRRHPLGRWRSAVAFLVLVPPALGAGVPVAVLVYRAALGTGPTEAGDVLVDAATTSFGLAAAAAAVAVVLALPVAVLAARFRSRFTAVVETLSLAGYALPGLVIALALVFFAARYLPVIYQTLPLVAAAYVIRFFPEALGAARSAVSAVDPALEEAGRSLGDTRVGVLRRVTLPLVRRSLLAGGALVFLTAMKELPATLLLRPAGVDTLATRVWTGASEGFYTQAAPAGLLLVAISALGLLAVGRLHPDRPSE